MTPAGLRDDILEERPRDVAVEQPVPILREGRGRPHRVVHPQPTNQRNSRLYSICSISIRSLRTE
jgi:hypothetical protein